MKKSNSVKGLRVWVVADRDELKRKRKHYREIWMKTEDKPHDPS